MPLLKNSGDAYRNGHAHLNCARPFAFVFEVDAAKLVQENKLRYKTPKQNFSSYSFFKGVTLRTNL